MMQNLSLYWVFINENGLVSKSKLKNRDQTLDSNLKYVILLVLLIVLSFALYLYQNPHIKS